MDQRKPENTFLPPTTDEFLGDLALDFARVDARAHCVICPRTTPRQKAKYVEAIQRLGRMTLAVGDRGNDVTGFSCSFVHILPIVKEKRGDHAGDQLPVFSIPRKRTHFVSSEIYSDEDFWSVRPFFMSSTRPLIPSDHVISGSL
jgi:hypothetical protein